MAPWSSTFTTELRRSETKSRMFSDSENDYGNEGGMTKKTKIIILAAVSVGVVAIIGGVTYTFWPSSSSTTEVPAPSQTPAGTTPASTPATVARVTKPAATRTVPPRKAVKGKQVKVKKVKPTPAPKPEPTKRKGKGKDKGKKEVKETVKLPKLKDTEKTKTPPAPPANTLLSEADLRGYDQWIQTKKDQVSRLSEAIDAAHGEVDGFVKQISDIDASIKKWVDAECPIENGCRSITKLIQICKRSATHGQNLRDTIIRHLKGEKAKFAVLATDDETSKILKRADILKLDTAILNAKNFTKAKYDTIAAGLVEKGGILEQKLQELDTISKEMEGKSKLVADMAKVKEDALAAFQLLKTAYPTKFEGHNDLSAPDRRVVLPADATQDHKDANAALTKYYADRARYDLAHDLTRGATWKEWIVSGVKNMNPLGKFSFTFRKPSIPTGWMPSKNWIPKNPFSSS